VQVLKKKRVLVTGSSGMLGEDIYLALSDYYEVYGVDLNISINIPTNYQYKGDITDPIFLDSVLRRVSPEIVIHCAAIVNLAMCGKDKSRADALHIDATQQLANSSTYKIVFISSDSIFNGKKGMYREADSPDPINYYGMTKFRGEEIVSQNPNHLILRTNIFGFNNPLKNSLAEWGLENISKKKIITGFTDIYFNPIYTKHFAVGLLELLNLDTLGTFHLASKNQMSKYSFLKYLEYEFMQKGGIVEKSLSTNYVMNPPRPINPSLNVDKISKYIELPTVEEGIEALVRDYKEVQNEYNKNK
jgi:dTDP-4-dehydrorhamnose reductase